MEGLICHCEWVGVWRGHGDACGFGHPAVISLRKRPAVVASSVSRYTHNFFLPSGLRMISGSSPINLQTRLIQVRRSLTLSRSYKDSHIDANSLVRYNREWLSPRVDAFCNAFFCWAFLGVENVSARWQRDAIVSGLVYRQPRDFSFPVLTQDDQWVFGISFGRRLRHVIRFNRPDHDNPQMPLQETLRRCFSRCSASQCQKNASSRDRGWNRQHQDGKTRQDNVIITRIHRQFQDERGPPAAALFPNQQTAAMARLNPVSTRPANVSLRK